MMDHLRERWECIRDFVYFDGVVRVGKEDMTAIVDSQKMLFPRCDDYLLPADKREVELNDELFFKNHWDMGDADA